MTLELPRLMLVTDRQRSRPGAMRASIAAGVPFIQVREKDLVDTELAAAIACIAKLTEASESNGKPASGPLLCVNGRPELARRLEIGLHLPADFATLGSRDFPLLGRSAHDDDEVERARSEAVDYLIVGTLFSSASKPGRAPLGLHAFAELVRRAEPIPVFAIGGITPDRVAAVLACGGYGVAVTGAILQADDPAATTQTFLEELQT